MKGLKKLFLASMVAVAGLSLASCGGKKNKTTEPTENTETTPEGPKYENNVLNRLTDIESSFNNINEFVVDGVAQEFLDVLAQNKVAKISTTTRRTDYDGDDGTEIQTVEVGYSDEYETLVNYVKSNEKGTSYTYNSSKQPVIDDKNYDITNYQYNLLATYNPTCYFTDYKCENNDDSTSYSSHQSNDSSTGEFIAYTLLQNKELMTAVKNFVTIENAKKLATDAIDFAKNAATPVFSKFVELDEEASSDAKKVYTVKFDEILKFVNYDSNTGKFGKIKAFEKIDELYGEKTSDAIVNELVALYDGQSTRAPYLNEFASTTLQTLGNFMSITKSEDFSKFLTSFGTEAEFALPDQAVILSLLSLDVAVEEGKTTFMATIPDMDKPDSFKKVDLEVDYSNNDKIEFNVGGDFGEFKAVASATENGIDFEAGAYNSAAKMFTVAAKLSLNSNAEHNKIDFMVNVVSQALVTGSLELNNDKLAVSFEGSSYNGLNPVLAGKGKFEATKNSIDFNIFNVEMPQSSYNEVYDSKVGDDIKGKIEFTDKFSIADEVKSKTNVSNLLNEGTYSNAGAKVEVTSEGIKTINNQYSASADRVYANSTTYYDTEVVYTLKDNITPDMIRRYEEYSDHETMYLKTDAAKSATISTKVYLNGKYYIYNFTSPYAYTVTLNGETVDSPLTGYEAEQVYNAIFKYLTISLTISLKS